MRFGSAPKRKKPSRFLDWAGLWFVAVWIPRPIALRQMTVFTSLLFFDLASNTFRQGLESQFDHPSDQTYNSSRCMAWEIAVTVTWRKIKGYKGAQSIKRE